MSNKSGNSSQVISLPTGGGALHGIGEKFSADLQTGTGNFSVPIALPPGRNGFQPQLNLAYSSGQGHGQFGLGWSLGIPGVRRRTSKGVCRYDESDVFILSGAEDLVPVGQSGASTRYRPRTEGLFAHIDRRRDDVNDYWRVEGRDGLVSVYGTPRPLPVSPDWRDPAAIADPDRPRHFFAWKLTRTIDPFGNRIDYVYERDPTQTEGTHRWDQIYLSEIRYADYGDPANPNFLVTVRFVYEDRPDHFSEYRAGFEIRTVRRCTRIEVWTHADADRLTRTYELIYLDRRGLPAEQLPANAVSLLSQIKMAGHNGNLSEELPPLEFGYTRFEPGRRDFFPITGPDMPPASLAHPDYELAGLFGNGLPDVLQMNGVVRYWRNLGGGRFDAPREMASAPSGLVLADPSVQMIDANGDGRIDLLVNSIVQSGYYPLQFGGLWDRRSFQRYRVAPTFDLKDPEVRLVDLDGDGVTDAIRSGARLECFFNDPEEGWSETRWVERRELEVFPNINFSDPRVKWGDMSGDGLQDPVLVYDGNVEYWPSLGRGAWGKRIHMENSPRFPFGYDPKRILLGDVDGDGLADIVYVDDTKVTLWINRSGNRWSDPVVIEGTPPVSDMDAVRLTDMLGSGISGVLWSTAAGGALRQTMYFLDFTGGAKPYLLNEMNNNIGAITRTAYSPSTRFYREDELRRETRWKTPLPFPVQVVAQLEVIDAISGGKLTTEYSYHHGYWDGAEREFRGFGRVDHRDTETFARYHGAGLHSGAPFEAVAPAMFSPPLETRTWFSQGPVGDESGDWTEADYTGEFWPGDAQALSRPPAMTALLKSMPRQVRRSALRTLRGNIVRSELYARDGAGLEDRPYTVTEALYGVREEQPPVPGEPDRERIFFPFPLGQRTTRWERGNDPLTQFSFTGGYDAYGQAMLQASIAVPRTPGDPYLAVQTATSFAQRDDAQVYLVNRVALVTSSEVVNDGSSSVFALRDDILAATATLRTIGQTLNFYDGPVFQGLPLGQIGAYGALVRTESLALTEEILWEAYKSGSAVLATPEEPPYFARNAPPAWTPEYPKEFQDLLPPLAGYVFYPGGGAPGPVRGFFVEAARRRYDFHNDPGGKGRGLALTQRDPLGRDTAIRYDQFELLPVEVTDSAELKTAALYDYRVLRPFKVTDPNGSQALLTFTPLGLVDSSWFSGSAGEGDQGRPSVRLTYDFTAFAIRGEPVSVRTLRQLHHDTETDVPQPQRDETIESVQYSDGFGRLLQARAEAEDAVFGDPVFGDAGLPADQSLAAADAVAQPAAPGAPPLVVVSGWQIYDNKGRVVERYEPFFSSGWPYEQPSDAQRGQKTAMFYEGCGRIVRTVHADGSEQRVVYGVPDLTDPSVFEPTPWEVYTYDANDNAGRTHPAASSGYQQHWNTPSSARVDALGRTVEVVARNGPNPLVDWYRMASAYDIQGNLLTVTDALQRIAFRHVFDLAGRSLRIEKIDAGVRRTILDAAGNVIEARDAKGALALHSYDALNRSVRLWARDGAAEQVGLRGRMTYGDGADSGLSPPQAAAANLLGKPYQIYDEAGVATVESYDFMGKPLEKVRQVIGSAQILNVFAAASSNNWQVQAYRVDWQPPAGITLAQYAGAVLDAAVYRTSFRYDALSRVKLMRYPNDVNGIRQQLLPGYNRAGALERVDLGGANFVERVAYNAKGQRVLISYGNGTMTRHAYDPRTFRLARMRTEPYSKPGMLAYHPSGAPLQDYAYSYDLAGNPTKISDRTPAAGIPNTVLGMDALDRDFTYDPVYRLLSSTGRECSTPAAAAPWDDFQKCEDVTLTRAYSEVYSYDAAGNMVQLQHQAAGGGFVRPFALAAGNNRLASVTAGQAVFGYSYDLNGNLMAETLSRHLEWDHADRLRVYRTQAGNAEPSKHAHYLYDAGGQRVKKLVRSQGGNYEVTVYVEGVFEHHLLTQGGVTQENNTIHVMDSQSRIAMVRIGNPFPGETSPSVLYHLGDHIGSGNLAIDGGGAWIKREEYTPYGDTSFGSFAKKRYRFTGQERDEESGLYYHGARYYAPWLARWASVDPVGLPAGANLYRYAFSNPVRFSDTNGADPTEKPKDAVLPLGLAWRTFTVPTGESQKLYAWESVLTQAAKDTGLKPLDVRAIPNPTLPNGLPEDVWNKLAPGALKPGDPKLPVGMQSAVQVQAAFEPGSPFGAVHITTDQVTVLGEFHTPAELRSVIANVASGNNSQVDVYFLENGKLSKIPAGTEIVVGAPLPDRIAKLLPESFSSPKPEPPASPPAAPTPTPPVTPAIPNIPSAPTGLAPTVANAGKTLARGLVPGAAETEDFLQNYGNPFSFSTLVAAAAGQASAIGHAAGTALKAAGAALDAAGAAASSFSSGLIVIPESVLKSFTPGGGPGPEA